MKLIALSIIAMFSMEVFAQNLLQERIWKISSRKRSIFLNKGVFHSSKNPVHQNLTGVRSSYVKSRGFERIVFDFSSPKPPQVYGLISSEKKVFVDLFNTSMSGEIAALKHVKYVKSVDFYPIDEKNLSVEINFNGNYGFDVFYLENPGRLVIDVKK